MHLTFTQHTTNHITVSSPKYLFYAYHADGTPSPRVTIAFHGNQSKQKKGAEKYWNARLVNGAMRTAIESPWWMRWTPKTNTAQPIAVHKVRERYERQLTNKQRMAWTRGRAKESCPCRANDNVPVPSPLWDVDCFSLSARPQVRCRERRRCDYQSTMREVLDEKRAVADHQPIVQLVAATPVSNSHNNHARMLVQSSDLSDNEQTQCWWSWLLMISHWKCHRSW